MKTSGGVNTPIQLIKLCQQSFPVIQDDYDRAIHGEYAAQVFLREGGTKSINFGLGSGPHFLLQSSQSNIKLGVRMKICPPEQR